MRIILIVPRILSAGSVLIRAWTWWTLVALGIAMSLGIIQPREAAFAVGSPLGVRPLPRVEGVHDYISRRSGSSAGKRLLGF
jgi:hypothetical protein